MVPPIASWVLFINKYSRQSLTDRLTDCLIINLTNNYSNDTLFRWFEVVSMWQLTLTKHEVTSRNTLEGNDFPSPWIYQQQIVKQWGVEIPETFLNVWLTDWPIFVQTPVQATSAALSSWHNNGCVFPRRQHFAVTILIFLFYILCILPRCSLNLRGDSTNVVFRVGHPPITSSQQLV